MKRSRLTILAAVLLLALLAPAAWAQEAGPGWNQFTFAASGGDGWTQPLKGVPFTYYLTHDGAADGWLSDDYQYRCTAAAQVDVNLVSVVKDSEKNRLAVTLVFPQAGSGSSVTISGYYKNADDPFAAHTFSGEVLETQREPLPFAMVQGPLALEADEWVTVATGLSSGDDYSLSMGGSLTIKDSRLSGNAVQVQFDTATVQAPNLSTLFLHLSRDGKIYTGSVDILFGDAAPDEYAIKVEGVDAGGGSVFATSPAKPVTIHFTVTGPGSPLERYDLGVFIDESCPAIELEGLYFNWKDFTFTIPLSGKEGYVPVEFFLYDRLLPNGIEHPLASVDAGFWVTKDGNKPSLPSAITPSQSAITLAPGDSRDLCTLFELDPALKPFAIFSLNDDSDTLRIADGELVAFQQGNSGVSARLPGTDVSATVQVNVEGEPLYYADYPSPQVLYKSNPTLNLSLYDLEGNRPNLGTWSSSVIELSCGDKGVTVDQITLGAEGALDITFAIPEKPAVNDGWLFLLLTDKEGNACPLNLWFHLMDEAAMPFKTATFAQVDGFYQGLPIAGQQVTYTLTPEGDSPVDWSSIQVAVDDSWNATAQAAIVDGKIQVTATFLNADDSGWVRVFAMTGENGDTFFKHFYAPEQVLPPQPQATISGIEIDTQDKDDGTHYLAIGAEVSPECRFEAEPSSEPTVFYRVLDAGKNPLSNENGILNYDGYGAFTAVSAGRVYIAASVYGSEPFVFGPIEVVEPGTLADSAPTYSCSLAKGTSVGLYYMPLGGEGVYPLQAPAGWTESWLNQHLTYSIEGNEGCIHIPEARPLQVYGVNVSGSDGPATISYYHGEKLLFKVEVTVFEAQGRAPFTMGEDVVFNPGDLDENNRVTIELATVPDGTSLKDCWGYAEDANIDVRDMRLVAGNVVQADLELNPDYIYRRRVFFHMQRTEDAEPYAGWLWVTYNTQDTVTMPSLSATPAAQTEVFAADGKPVYAARTEAQTFTYNITTAPKPLDIFARYEIDAQVESAIQNLGWSFDFDAWGRNCEDESFVLPIQITLPANATGLVNVAVTMTDPTDGNTRSARFGFWVTEDGNAPSVSGDGISTLYTADNPYLLTEGIDCVPLDVLFSIPEGYTIQNVTCANDAVAFPFNEYIFASWNHYDIVSVSVIAANASHQTLSGAAYVRVVPREDTSVWYREQNQRSIVQGETISMTMDVQRNGQPLDISDTNTYAVEFLSNPWLTIALDNENSALAQGHIAYTLTAGDNAASVGEFPSYAVIVRQNGKVLIRQNDCVRVFAPDSQPPFTSFTRVMDETQEDIPPVKGEPFTLTLRPDKTVLDWSAYTITVHPQEARYTVNTDGTLSISHTFNDYTDLLVDVALGEEQLPFARYQWTPSGLRDPAPKDVAGVHIWFENMDGDILPASQGVCFANEGEKVRLCATGVNDAGDSVAGYYNTAYSLKTLDTTGTNWNPIPAQPASGPLVYAGEKRTFTAAEAGRVRVRAWVPGAGPEIVSEIELAVLDGDFNFTALGDLPGYSLKKGRKLSLHKATNVDGETPFAAYDPALLDSILILEDDDEERVLSTDNVLEYIALETTDEPVEIRLFFNRDYRGYHEGDLFAHFTVTVEEAGEAAIFTPSAPIQMEVGAAQSGATLATLTDEGKKLNLTSEDISVSCADCLSVSNVRLSDDGAIVADLAALDHPCLSSLIIVAEKGERQSAAQLLVAADNAASRALTLSASLADDTRDTYRYGEIVVDIEPQSVPFDVFDRFQPQHNLNWSQEPVEDYWYHDWSDWRTGGVLPLVIGVQGDTHVSADVYLHDPAGFIDDIHADPVEFWVNETGVSTFATAITANQATVSAPWRAALPLDSLFAIEPAGATDVSYECEGGVWLSPDGRWLLVDSAGTITATGSKSTPETPISATVSVAFQEAPYWLDGASLPSSMRTGTFRYTLQFMNKAQPASLAGRTVEIVSRGDLNASIYAINQANGQITLSISANAPCYGYVMVLVKDENGNYVFCDRDIRAIDIDQPIPFTDLEQDGEADYGGWYPPAGESYTFSLVPQGVVSQDLDWDAYRVWAEGRDGTTKASCTIDQENGKITVTATYQVDSGLDVYVAFKGDSDDCFFAQYNYWPMVGQWPTNLSAEARFENAQGGELSNLDGNNVALTGDTLELLMTLYAQNAGEDPHPIEDEALLHAIRYSVGFEVNEGGVWKDVSLSQSTPLAPAEEGVYTAKASGLIRGYVTLAGGTERFYTSPLYVFTPADIAPLEAAASVDAPVGQLTSLESLFSGRFTAGLALLLEAECDGQYIQPLPGNALKLVGLEETGETMDYALRYRLTLGGHEAETNFAVVPVNVVKAEGAPLIQGADNITLPPSDESSGEQTISVATLTDAGARLTAENIRVSMDGCSQLRGVAVEGNNVVATVLPADHPCMSRVVVTAVSGSYTTAVKLYLRVEPQGYSPALSAEITSTPPNGQAAYKPGDAVTITATLPEQDPLDRYSIVWQLDDASGALLDETKNNDWDWDSWNADYEKEGDKHLPLKLTFAQPANAALRLHYYDESEDAFAASSNTMTFAVTQEGALPTASTKIESKYSAASPLVLDEHQGSVEPWNLFTIEPQGAGDVIYEVTAGQNSVDMEDGWLFARETGDAQVTATSAINPALTATAHIRVVKPVNQTGIYWFDDHNAPGVAAQYDQTLAGVLVLKKELENANDPVDLTSYQLHSLWDNLESFTATAGDNGEIALSLTTPATGAAEHASYCLIVTDANGIGVARYERDLRLLDEVPFNRFQLAPYENEWENLPSPGWDFVLRLRPDAGNYKAGVTFEARGARNIEVISSPAWDAATGEVHTTLRFREEGGDNGVTVLAFYQGEVIAEYWFNAWVLPADTTTLESVAIGGTRESSGQLYLEISEDPVPLACTFADPDGKAVVFYAIEQSTDGGATWAEGEDFMDTTGESKLYARAEGLVRVRAHSRLTVGPVYTRPVWIVAKYPSAADLSITCSPLTYSGKAQKPDVTVKATVKEKEITLTEGEDYTLTFPVADAIDAGDYPLTVTCLGQYAGMGPKTVEFTIQPKALKDTTVALESESLVYNRQPQEPAVTVTDGETKLSANTDYTLEYANNTNATTADNLARVNVTGIGNYAGTVQKTFAIGPKPLADGMIRAIPDQPWTGEAIKPALTLIDGATLVEGTDYTVEYPTASTDVGTDYTVTVTGKGNYTGTATASFNIVPAAQAAPSGVTGIAPSIKGASDGKLTGLTAAMEYKAESDEQYTTGPKAEKLPAGAYRVRYAQTATHDASPDAVVTVPEGTRTLTATFNPNYPGGAVRQVSGLSYGATPAAPDFQREGYTLTAWNTAADGTGAGWTSGSSQITEDVTLYAQWTGKTVSYTVEHYFEDLTGGYVLDGTKVATETKSGTVGGQTQAVAQTVEGFSAQTIQQQAIAPSATVVKVYYTRNSYTLTFTADGKDISKETLKYGAPIVPPSVRVEGKIFKGWDQEVPSTMPAEPKTFDATLEAANQSYTVKHLKQQVEKPGEYDLVLEESISGPTSATADELKPAAQKTYVGFGAPAAELEDTTTLTLKYDRSTYTLKLGTNDNVTANVAANIDSQGKIRYGAPVTVSAEWADEDTEKANDWLGWASSDENLLASATTGDYTFNMPAGEVTLTPKTEVKRYTVVFDPNGGAGGATKVLAHGTTDFGVAVPTRQGYTFDGKWYRDKACQTQVTSITGSATLYAGWAPKGDTPYKVEHYQQALDGSYVLKDTAESFTGTTAVTPTLTPKSDAGFTYDEKVPGTVASAPIAADGSTVFKLYYTRNSHTLTFKSGYDNQPIFQAEVKYGSPITPPTVAREGYTFAGWDSTPDETMPDADTTYTASWTPNPDTRYRVEHYAETLTEGEYMLRETETLAGTTAAMATATGKGYPGFAYSDQAPGTLSSAPIAADGSTVLKLYYSRNSYALTFDLGYKAKAEDSENIKSVSQVKYGALITPPAPTRSGYGFAGWSPTPAETMPGSDATYTAQWVAGTGTKYCVIHHKQGLNGGWEEEIETRSGVTGATVTAAPKSFEGFTYVPGYGEGSNDDDKEVLSGTIAADGKLELHLYYTRNRYALMFDANGGSGSSVTTKAYGEAISAPTPARTGYKFTRWSPAVPQTMPAANATFTAAWETVSMPYTIEHYRAGQDGAYPNEPYTRQNLEAPAGFMVTASPFTYTGFTYDGARSAATASGTQTAEGGLTLKLYYARNRHTLTFDAGKGTGGAQESVTYGAPIVVPQVSRPGYTLTGWDFAPLSSMPDRDLTYTAQWTANPDTPYRVEHYLENLDGSWPVEPSLSQSLTGETDSNLKAADCQRAFEGFTLDAKDVRMVADVALAGDGSTVIKLYYTRNLYLLQFDTDGDGEVDIELRVKYGALINQQLVAVSKAIGQAASGAQQVTIQTPIKENMVFNGWRIENGTKSVYAKGDGETAMPGTVTGDILCTAQYSNPTDPTFVMIYYLPDGGDYKKEGPDRRYTDGPATGAVVPRAYPGYMVDYYVVDDGKPQPEGIITTKKDREVKVEVYYKTAAYTLTVNSQTGVKELTLSGGTLNSKSNASIPQGTDVTVTATADSNYTFAGFEADYPNLGASYDAANRQLSFTMPKGNVNLTAKAEPKTFTITYSTGSVDADTSNLPKTYTYGKVTPLPQLVSRDGKKMTRGWKIGGNGSAVSELSDTQSGDITLTADWAKVVEVTFNAGEEGRFGTDKKDTEVTLSGAAGAKLTPPTPVRDGYTYTWEPALPGVFPDANATYTAQWTKDAGGNAPGGNPPAGEKIPVTGATLPQASVEVGAGKTAAIRFSLEPAGANDYTVTYHSDNTAVATVDATGAITGVGEGTATITITIVSGGQTFTLTCQVTVKAAGGPDEPDEPDKPEKPVTIATVVDTLAIRKGKSFSLPKFRGATVSWSVADDGVAALNKSGTGVKGLKEGQTTLTLTVESVSKAKGVTFDGHGLKAGQRYTIDLNVRKSGELATKVSVSPKKLTLDLKENKTATLSATAAPAKKVKDKEIFWASKDPNIATVDKDGKVTAVAPGTTTIYAYATSLKMAKVTVTVKGLVTKLSFVNEAGKQIKKARVAASETLRLTVKANADAVNQAFTFTSSKPKVATVDQDGVVTALKKGKTTITVKATDGSGKKAKITITVK